jgi:hypothetical protein
MLGLDARRVSMGVFILVAGLLPAVPARAFAPTPATAPAWADGGVCRRLRSGNAEMVDVAFTAPRIATLRTVHLRLDPGPARGKGRYLLRLETDAGGVPSGQALATTEVVAGAEPWIAVPLGPVALSGQRYHLTLGLADRTTPATSRVCFLKHVDDLPGSDRPWSATLRDESTLAPLPVGAAVLEPVFLLEMSDGSLWGQPYHDMRNDVLLPGGALAWSFAPAADVVVSSVVARLAGRDTGSAPRFAVSEAAGAELASGTLSRSGARGDWKPAWAAELPRAIVLRAGRGYELQLSVPDGARGVRFVHRTPESDFPGTLPASVARASGTAAAGRYLAPSVELLGTTAADSVNLAPNPGFENDPVADWFTASGAPSATYFPWATDQVHGGKRSVKIVSQQQAGTVSRWLGRNDRIPASAGVRYAATVWLRTANVTNEALVAMNFWDGTAWNHLATTESQNRLRGSNGWTQVAVDAVAPAGTGYLRVEARLGGSGTLWADDVAVARADATSAPAPTPTPVTGATRTPRPTRTPGVAPQPTPSPTPRPSATPTPRPTSLATPAPLPTDGSGAACAGRYYVATGGNDANAGTAASPFRTIQRAANVASAGDTVCVAVGTYRERVRLQRSGTSGAPIVFRGSAGTVVDGGDVHASGWTNATEFGRNANGVYPVWKKKFTFADGSTPYHGTLDGSYILRLRDTDYSGNPMMSNCFESPATCAGGNRMKHGPRGYNTANSSGTVYQSWTTPGTVDAFFGVDGGWTYVAFKDGGSPNGRDLTFAPKNAGAFQVEASFVTIRGFTIRGANYPVYLTGGNAHHVTVASNTVRNGFYGIFLAGGAHDNVVRANDVSLAYGHSMNPADPWKWFTWNAFRNNSELHRASISMSGGGAANEIVGNVIHDVFSGIDEDGSTPAGNGVRVHDNTVTHCMNDGLTITGGADSQWYDNVLTDVNIGARFWPYGNGATVSFYRNRISLPDSPLVEACMFFFRGSSTDALRLYHNSCSAPLGLLFGSTNVSPGLPLLRVYDNLFSVRSLVTANDWTGWSANFASSSRKPDVAYNWSSAAVASWMSPTNVKGGGLLWTIGGLTSWLLDGSLAASAQQMGYDVTRSNSTLRSPWPGFAPGYFGGAAPDAGAVQVN